MNSLKSNQIKTAAELAKDMKRPNYMKYQEQLRTLGKEIIEINNNYKKPE